MEFYLSSEICKQIKSASSVSSLYKHKYSLMQILLSVKIGALKLYDKEQPMEQWGLFNNFIPKDWQRETPAPTHPAAVAGAEQVWSGCGHTRASPSPHAAPTLRLPRGLRSAPSAPRDNTLHSLPVHMCAHRHRLPSQICVCSYKSIDSA